GAGRRGQGGDGDGRRQDELAKHGTSLLAFAWIMWIARTCPAGGGGPALFRRKRRSARGAGRHGLRIGLARRPFGSRRREGAGQDRLHVLAAVERAQEAFGKGGAGAVVDDPAVAQGHHARAV